MDDSVDDKTILIVDDDIFLADLYKTVLAEVGFKIEVAFDDEEALKKAREKFYDIILLDIMMPKLDGIGVLDAIAKENIKLGKIVVLTNFGQEELKKQALNFGVSDYLLKYSTSPQELSDKVKLLI